MTHYRNAIPLEPPQARCLKRNLLVLISQYEQESRNPQLPPEDRFYAEVEATTLGEVVDLCDALLARAKIMALV